MQTKLANLKESDRIVLKAIEAANAFGRRITLRDVNKIAHRLDGAAWDGTSRAQYHVDRLVFRGLVEKVGATRNATLVAKIPGRDPHFEESIGQEPHS